MVTTSGMCSAEPLNCSLAALGRDRVMFAADYPFESAQEAGEFLDHAPLAEPLRDDIAFNNADRVFRAADILRYAPTPQAELRMTPKFLSSTFTPKCMAMLQAEFPDLQFALPTALRR